ncbi:glycerophosphodiester phosphodiesterase [Mesorhizobium sp. BR1-1-16]|uniref:glycerophosphodiester phosphodiesterase n=1 Tax=Mesorhizobium sp. BR1-1-16 TaxID=2876653 RepID=UPI001CCA611E|nr:glycerophosphodiester phosphodiesterase family protein [Mesorhizobium sp. BR1-1-16]MBZ9939022.1 glycerophosphodiester phosphodiesterase [Mesorhizobium sp. BR1-1-16]
MREISELPDAPRAADGVAIWSGYHRVRLKWHRMKRRVEDIPFTPAILREALAAGASSEVDLRAHGEDGFVVLHDDRLDRETSGSGLVAAADSALLRALTMRASDGTITDERVLLLDDLAELAAGDAAADALVQLDLKEEASAITPAVIARFARLIGPVAQRFILSGGDWTAVRRLAEATPGLAAGFDPCSDDTIERLNSGADLDVFVAEALAAAPRASTIYLHYPIVLKAASLGHDIIGAFHDADRLIDAYTLNTTHADAARTLRQLVALEVDQITTDEPIALQALFESSDTSQA